MQFEILYIFSDLNAWIVRQLNPGEPFEILPQSTLGGIPLHPTLSMPRSLDENGNLRLDTFVMRPLHGKDLHQLKMGDRVELVTGN